MQPIPVGYGQVYNFLLALIPGETFQVLPSSWNAFRFPMIFLMFFIPLYPSSESVSKHKSASYFLKHHG